MDRNYIVLGKKITFPKSIISDLRSKISPLRVTICYHTNMLLFFFKKDGDFSVKEDDNSIWVASWVNKNIQPSDLGQKRTFTFYPENNLIAFAIKDNGNVITHERLRGMTTKDFNEDAFISKRKRVITRKNDNEIIVRPDGRLYLPRQDYSNALWTCEVEADETEMTIHLGPTTHKRLEVVIDKATCAINVKKLLARYNRLPQETFTEKVIVQDNIIRFLFSNSLNYFGHGE